MSKIYTEQLPEPLESLANEIRQLNQEWVENHQGTYGADYLKENDFTRNQERWIREIHQQLQGDSE